MIHKNNNNEKERWKLPKQSDLDTTTSSLLGIACAAGGECCEIISDVTKAKTCDKCVAVTYCSVDCQQRHEAVHRNYCGHIVACRKLLEDTLEDLEKAKEEERGQRRTTSSTRVLELMNAHNHVAHHLLRLLGAVETESDDGDETTTKRPTLAMRWRALHTHRLLKLYECEDVRFDLTSLIVVGKYQTAYDAMRMIFRRNSEYITIMERQVDERERRGGGVVVDDDDSEKLLKAEMKALRQKCVKEGYDISLNQAISHAVLPLEFMTTYKEGRFEENMDIAEPLSTLRFRESTSIGNLMYLSYLKFELYKVRRTLATVDNGFLFNTDIATHVAEFMVGETVAKDIMKVDAARLLHQTKEALSFVQAQNIDFLDMINLPMHRGSFGTGSSVHRWTSHPEIDRTAANLSMKDRAVSEIDNAILLWRHNKEAWNFLNNFAKNVKEERVDLPSVGGRKARPFKTHSKNVAEYVHSRDYVPGSFEEFRTEVEKKPEALKLCRTLGLLDDNGRVAACATSAFVKLNETDRLSGGNLSLLFVNMDRLFTYMLQDRQSAALRLSLIRPTLEDSGRANFLPRTVFKTPVDVPLSLADGHSMMVRGFVAAHHKMPWMLHKIAPHGEVDDFIREFTRGGSSHQHVTDAVVLNF
jgi:hypothetical protein